MTTPGRQAAWRAAIRALGPRYAGAVPVRLRESIAETALNAYERVLAEQPREDERLKIALMERDWLLGAWAAACRIPQAEAEAEMLKWSEKWRDAALNAEENPNARS